MSLFPYLEIKTHDFRFLQIHVLAEIVNNSAVSLLNFLWSRPFKCQVSCRGLFVCVCVSACFQITRIILLNLTSLFHVKRILCDCSQF